MRRRRIRRTFSCEHGGEITHQPSPPAPWATRQRPHAPILQQLRAAQLQLQELYDLEPAPDIVDFVHFDERVPHETVLVQEESGCLNLAVLLQPISGPLTTFSDAYMQLLEGASHFVFLSERARTELPTTLLELELQAEVDKFALTALPDVERSLSPRAIHEWLYERTEFLHPPETVIGNRYRLANQLAARVADALLQHSDPERTRRLLRQFYRSGQAEKIRMASSRDQLTS